MQGRTGKVKLEDSIAKDVTVSAQVVRKTTANVMK